jgi:hypothetical protein
MLFGRYLSSRTEPDTWNALYCHHPIPELSMAAITFAQTKSDGVKQINFLSNLYAGTRSITKPNGTVLPDVAHDYNVNMGFVDQMDAGCLQHMYLHRLVNWKHAVFFWLVEATARNAWLIWSRLPCGKKEDFHTFRRELAFELRAKGLHLPTATHGLVHLRTPTKCSACKKIGINSNTSLCCAYCNFLPLHRRCYHILHQRKQTSQGRKRKRFQSDSTAPTPRIS